MQANIVANMYVDDEYNCNQNNYKLKGYQDAVDCLASQLGSSYVHEVNLYVAMVTPALMINHNLGCKHVLQSGLTVDAAQLKRIICTT